MEKNEFLKVHNAGKDLTYYFDNLEALIGTFRIKKMKAKVAMDQKRFRVSRGFRSGEWIISMVDREEVDKTLLGS